MGQYHDRSANYRKLFWQSEDLPDKTIVKVYESEEGDICFEKNLMSPLSYEKIAV